MKNIKNIIKAVLFAFVLLGAINVSAAKSAPENLMACYVILGDGETQKKVSMENFLKLAQEHCKKNEVALSHDCKLMATWRKNGTIEITNIETHKTSCISGKAVEPYSLAFSPDGKSLIACYTDGTVVLWHIQSGEGIEAFCSQKYHAIIAGVNPDNTLLALGLLNKEDMDKPDTHMKNILMRKRLMILNIGTKEIISAYCLNKMPKEIYFFPGGKLVSTEGRSPTEAFDIHAIGTPDWFSTEL